MDRVPTGPMRSVLARLVDPVPTVRSAGDRRTSRLLALMLLTGIVLASFAIIGWAVSPGRHVASIEALTSAMSSLVFGGAYVLARYGRNRQAIWLAVVQSSLAVFVLQYAALEGLNPLYQATDGAELMFLALPMLLAGTFLPWKQVLGVGGVLLSLMLAIPSITGHVSYAELIPGPVMLVLTATMLTATAGAHRERLETERSAVLRTEIEERRRAETELARNRDELERLVHERTENLEMAMRQLVEANEAKSRFLANMSHELRTPLNSIIGFTGVMRQGMAGPLSDEQERQLKMVDRSSRHLLGLINQVLDLSRIESGRETVDRDTFDVAGLLAEVVEVIEPLAAAQNLSIAIDRTELGELASVTTDRGKLRQILLNLAGNAVKFTDRGGVRLSVREMGDTVVVTVADTGIGIAPEHLSAVFDEYRQISGSREAKPQGTGLGLTVSRRLARLLGGDIQVASALGAGSRFSVVIAKDPAPA
jgi:signal transduction histidine kinase